MAARSYEPLAWIIDVEEGRVRPHRKGPAALRARLTFEVDMEDLWDDDDD